MRTLDPPATLIFNPHAGYKLGISTNSAGPEQVMTALHQAGIPFEPRPTERPGHATELARQAVAERRGLVIAAGGDGTVAEVGAALVNTDVVMGIIPSGSVMNTARTLAIPRDLPGAAATIASGAVLAMDVGRVADRYFLEACGVGLVAGLFRYFDRLDSGAAPSKVFQNAIRFLRGLGTPRVVIEADGRQFMVRTPMVTVANGPFVGAAYALAPNALVDDGQLDVVVFRGAGVLRALFHLALVAGGRRLPPPREAQTFRARRITIATRSRRRPLPVHADGTVIRSTPVRLEVVPGALRVLVGTPDPATPPAWTTGLPPTGGGH